MIIKGEKKPPTKKEFKPKGGKEEKKHTPDSKYHNRSGIAEGGKMAKSITKERRKKKPTYKTKSKSKSARFASEIDLKDRKQKQLDRALRRKKQPPHKMNQKRMKRIKEK